MFTDIHASGRHAGLVNDLLDVSKIESAVGTFDLERCELRQLMESVAHELEPCWHGAICAWKAAWATAP